MSWNSSSSPTKNWNSICSSADGTTIHASTSDGFIYKSTDSGVSFSAVNGGSAVGTNIVQIVCNQAGTNVLALDSTSSVYYSTNAFSTHNTFSNGSFLFKYIAMSSDTTPRLLGVVSASTAYQSTNNITWSLFLSSASGPNNYIACGSSLTNSVGNIYVNHNNTGIYYSNNQSFSGMSPFPSKPLLSNVSCGYITCAQNSSNNVMTISGSTINYSTNSGASYNTNTLVNTITSIASSYDGSIITITCSDGNIYQSTTGPSGAFNVMSGYPTGLSFNSITSNTDSSILAATTTGNTIYNFDASACIMEGTELEIFENNNIVKKRIEDINKGDLIKIYGKIIDDRDIELFSSIFTEIKWIGKKEISVNNINCPVCVVNGENKFHISQKHRVIWNDKFIAIKEILHLDKGYEALINKNFDKLTYYHIETGEHNIINIGNVFTETMNNKPINRKMFFKEK